MQWKDLALEEKKELIEKCMKEAENVEGAVNLIAIIRKNAPELVFTSKEIYDFMKMI